MGVELAVAQPSVVGHQERLVAEPLDALSEDGGEVRLGVGVANGGRQIETPADDKVLQLWLISGERRRERFARDFDSYGELRRMMRQ